MKTEKPAKIINFVVHGEWIIALDENGNFWTCPIGRVTSMMGSVFPNPTYHPLVGEWQDLTITNNKT
jgi:hypothetical protein